MKKKIFVFLISCFFLPTLYAYNSNGHKVIAQIAYDNLTPETKARVEMLIPTIGQYYQIRTFVEGAPWPDWLKSDNVTAYNEWHYIDQPITQGPCFHCQITDPAANNVVWAIGQATQVLSTPDSKNYPQQSSFEKSMFLLFLEHFVGDIHQPLHNVSLFSNQYPTGDKGGNLYLIQSSIASNLHSFWDQGGGIFPSANMTDVQIRQLAASIEKAYPESSLSNVNDLDPADWSKEGKNLAEKVVYTIPANSKPSANYIQITQISSERQAALAGYRLAHLLNEFFE